MCERASWGQLTTTKLRRTKRTSSVCSLSRRAHINALMRVYEAKDMYQECSKWRALVCLHRWTKGLKYVCMQNWCLSNNGLRMKHVGYSFVFALIQQRTILIIISVEIIWRLWYTLTCHVCTCFVERCKIRCIFVVALIFAPVLVVLNFNICCNINKFVLVSIPVFGVQLCGWVLFLFLKGRNKL